jgi:hypothetical protein
VSECGSVRSLDLNGSRSSGFSRGAGVELGVQVRERLAVRVIETRNNQFHRLEAITEHRERGHAVDETARGHDLIATAFVEGLADGVRPLHKQFRERFVNAALLGHVLDENLALLRRRRVRLLKGEREAVQHGAVQHLRAGKAAFGVALALGVRRADDGEALLRLDPSVDLLDEDRLALKGSLEAHDLGRTLIHLIKQQHATALHGEDHRAVLPHHVAVHKAEATDQVLLIRERRDVDAEELALQVRADLLHHRGLAVAGQAGDEHGREDALLEDALHVLVVAERHIGGQLLGDHAAEFVVEGAEAHILSRVVDSGDRRSLHHRHGSDHGTRRCSSLRRLGSGGSTATDLRHKEQAATVTARLVARDPGRPREAVLRAVGVNDANDIGAREDRVRDAGLAGGLHEQRLLARKVREGGNGSSRDSHTVSLLYKPRRRKRLRAISLQIIQKS